MVLTSKERERDKKMRYYRKGDQVRIGKSGKVDYTVFLDQLTRVVFLQSNNTGKVTLVDMERVVLVQAVEDVSELNLPDVETTTGVNRPEPLTGMAELIIPDQTPAGTEPVSDEAWGNGPDVEPDKNDHRESVYGRTILGALNRLGKHVYAGTATTKRRNKAQKKAEKARRRQDRIERRAAYEASRTGV